MSGEASNVTSWYTTFRNGAEHSKRRLGRVAPTACYTHPRVSMLSLRTGFVVVGCVLAGFVTSAGPGLVARAAEAPREVEPALAPSDSALVVGGGEAQGRIAQLEQRLKELEAE